MTTTLTPAAQELLAKDRCERCGAQARVRFERGALDLLFCGHHGSHHEAALREQGFAITVDDREFVSANSAKDGAAAAALGVAPVEGEGPGSAVV